MVIKCEICQSNVKSVVRNLKSYLQKSQIYCIYKCPARIPTCIKIQQMLFDIFVSCLTMHSEHGARHQAADGVVHITHVFPLVLHRHRLYPQAAVLENGDTP